MFHQDRLALIYMNIYLIILFASIILIFLCLSQAKIIDIKLIDNCFFERIHILLEQ